MRWSELDPERSIKLESDEGEVPGRHAESEMKIWPNPRKGLAKKVGHEGTSGKVAANSKTPGV